MTNTYNWSHRKLTDEEAEEVRERHAKGESFAKLGKAFKISHTTARRIVIKKAYNYPNPLKAK